MPRPSSNSQSVRPHSRRNYSAAGLAEDQVEVIWLKNADPRPSVALPAPDSDALRLRTRTRRGRSRRRARYPNLKLMFISSRIYAGYAAVPLNPEPYAYDTDFR